jgi:hypothetical protein
MGIPQTLKLAVNGRANKTAMPGDEDARVFVHPGVILRMNRSGEA